MSTVCAQGGQEQVKEEEEEEEEEEGRRRRWEGEGRRGEGRAQMVKIPGDWAWQEDGREGESG